MPPRKPLPLSSSWGENGEDLVKSVDNYDGAFIYFDGNRPLVELNNYLGAGSSGVCYEALAALPSCSSSHSADLRRSGGSERRERARERRREEIIPPTSRASSSFELDENRDEELDDDEDDDLRTEYDDDEERDGDGRTAIAVKILHPLGYKLSREPLSSFEILREVVVMDRGVTVPAAPGDSTASHSTATYDEASLTWLMNKTTKEIIVGITTLVVPPVTSTTVSKRAKKRFTELTLPQCFEIWPQYASSSARELPSSILTATSDILVEISSLTPPSREIDTMRRSHTSTAPKPYLLPPKFSKFLLERQRILREVARMRLANGHENVIQLLDVLEWRQETKHTFFLLLELARGGELFDRIKLGSGCDEPLARRLFFQLLCGVRHCHSRGLVHRDLKPENLLLSLRGTSLNESDLNDNTCGLSHINSSSLKSESALSSSTPGVGIANISFSSAISPDKYVLKIADFGMSAVVGGGGHPQPSTYGVPNPDVAVAMPPLVRLSSLVGSPHYTAPEILRGSLYDGEKSDSFSAGVCLFAMLTCTLPFGPNLLTDARFREFSGWTARNRMRNGKEKGSRNDRRETGEEEEEERERDERAGTREYPTWLFPSRLSREVMELLCGLLDPIPEMRYSIHDALRSAWMRSEMELSNDSHLRHEILGPAVVVAASKDDYHGNTASKKTTRGGSLVIGGRGDEEDGEEEEGEFSERRILFDDDAFDDRRRLASRNDDDDVDVGEEDSKSIKSGVVTSAEKLGRRAMRVRPTSIPVDEEDRDRRDIAFNNTIDGNRRMSPRRPIIRNNIVNSRSGGAGREDAANITVTSSSSREEQISKSAPSTSTMAALMKMKMKQRKTATMEITTTRNEEEEEEEETRVPPPSTNSNSSSSSRRRSYSDDGSALMREKMEETYPSFASSRDLFFTRHHGENDGSPHFSTPLLVHRSTRFLTSIPARQVLILIQNLISFSEGTMMTAEGGTSGYAVSGVDWKTRSLLITRRETGERVCSVRIRSVASAAKEDDVAKSSPHRRGGRHLVEFAREGGSASTLEVRRLYEAVKRGLERAVKSDFAHTLEGL